MKKEKETPNQQNNKFKSPESKRSKIIEINSGKKKEAIKKFKQSNAYKKLETSNITASLVKSFNRSSGKLGTQKIEQQIQVLAKMKKEEAEILFNEQAKIFNKILWVRILSERITEDNDVSKLMFDSNLNKERQNKLAKIKQETFKTKNYLSIVEK